MYRHTCTNECNNYLNENLPDHFFCINMNNNVPDEPRPHQSDWFSPDKSGIYVVIPQIPPAPSGKPNKARVELSFKCGGKEYVLSRILFKGPPDIVAYLDHKLKYRIKDTSPHRVCFQYLSG